MKTVLILGATSAIARAAANAFAEKGYALHLAGRNQDELSRIAADLQIRHQVQVQHSKFDADTCQTHEPFLKKIVSKTSLGGVLLAFGDLGDHLKAVSDFSAAQLIIQRNFTGACSILTHSANYFRQQQKGFIIAISSVAGDRGRQSNYIYGSAKGGLSLYLQGLRNHLHPYGVRVITVKPGFVDTPMTFGKPGVFLAASPQRVGKRIIETLNSKQDVVYIPGFWKYIMKAIMMIPEPIFKRMKL